MPSGRQGMKLLEQDLQMELSVAMWSDIICSSNTLKN